MKTTGVGDLRRRQAVRRGIRHHPIIYIRYIYILFLKSSSDKLLFVGNFIATRQHLGEENWRSESRGLPLPP
jgi:hypothetical protein